MTGTNPRRETAIQLSGIVFMRWNNLPFETVQTNPTMVWRPRDCAARKMRYAPCKSQRPTVIQSGIVITLAKLVATTTNIAGTGLIR